VDKFNKISLLFQPPNCSCAIISRLIYVALSVQECVNKRSVIVVLPDPLGPATTINKEIQHLFKVDKFNKIKNLVRELKFYTQLNTQANQLMDELL
jgi:hypothetical protein